MLNIHQIGIVGAGTMGCGIAEVAAVAGLHVMLCDTVSEQLDTGLARTGSSLEKAARRGKLSQDIESILSRIDRSLTLTPLRDCDFIIEAIIENAAAKQQLHTELGRLARSDVVLASNTSSISITQLGESSGRPDLFIGMHFFNPVPIMPLVEVVRGRET